MISNADLFLKWNVKRVLTSDFAYVRDTSDDNQNEVVNKYKLWKKNALSHMHKICSLKHHSIR